MIYQSPLDLTAEELEEFEEVSGLDRNDLCERLLSSRLSVFRVGGLLLLVGAKQPTMLWLGCLQQGKTGVGWKALNASMRALARSWNCSRIVTTTTDPRVAKLVALMGGDVVEQTLVMEI